MRGNSCGKQWFCVEISIYEAERKVLAYLGETQPDCQLDAMPDNRAVLRQHSVPECPDLIWQTRSG